MSSLDRPYIRSPSSLVGSVIHHADRSIVLEYLCTALWPADNNSAAMCVRRTSSARHIQKISILKCDGHTYTQMQNEMRSRISCLALRRSAIIMSAKWSIPLPQPGSLLLQTLACLSSHGMLSKFHSFEKQHQLWRVGCLVMVVNVQRWYQCI